VLAWVALVAVAAVLAGALAAAGLGVLRSVTGRAAVVAAAALAATAVITSGTGAVLPGGVERALDPVWTAPLLALLVAAVAGTADRRRPPRARQVALGVGVAPVLAWVVAGVVVTVPAVAGLPVPAAVDAASPARLGTLTLTADDEAADGVATVTWTLDRGQPGPGTAATAAQVAGPPSPAVEELAVAVLGRAPDAGAPDRLARALAAQAVGWIVVDGPEAATAPLTAAVATRSGLGEVARVPGRAVWRVEREDASPPAPGDRATPGPPWRAAAPWAGAAVLVVLLVVATGRRTGAEPPPGLSRSSAGGPPAVPGPGVPRQAAVVATATGALALGLVAAVVAGVVAVPAVPVTRAATGAGEPVAPELARAVTLAAPGERAVCPGDTAAVTPEGADGSAGVVDPTDEATDEATDVAEAVVGDAGRSGLQAGVLTSGAGAGALVLAACPTAGDAGYAFTGGTTPGRRPRLVLANLGDVAAAVSVELLTASGRVPGGSAGSLTVEAGETVAVAVDALAVVDGVAAVEVRTGAGAVAAILRDTAVDGLRPAGTDDEALALPGTRLVIPVVTVPDAAALDGGVAGTTGSLVAVAVPGDAGGVARVTAVPAPDPGAPDAAPGAASTEVVPLVPGGTALVSLPGPGTWAVRVEADVPVVAAARSVRPRGEGAVDAGWAAGVAASDVSGTVVPVPALPEGATARLHLVAEADSVVDLDLLDDTGAVVDTRRLEVVAGAAVSADLAPVADGARIAGVRLRSAPGDAGGTPAGGAVEGAVGLALSSADGLATTTVPPDPAEGTVIRLVPR
jgi:hypothetical protein